jgi:hypothetical protein
MVYLVNAVNDSQQIHFGRDRHLSSSGYKPDLFITLKKRQPVEGACIRPVELGVANRLCSLRFFDRFYVGVGLLSDLPQIVFGLHSNPAFRARTVHPGFEP